MSNIASTILGGIMIGIVVYASVLTIVQYYGVS
jgi:hypothetical protein